MDDDDDIGLMKNGHSSLDTSPTQSPASSSNEGAHYGEDENDLDSQEDDDDSISLGLPRVLTSDMMAMHDIIEEEEEEEEESEGGWQDEDESTSHADDSDLPSMKQGNNNKKEKWKFDLGALEARKPSYRNLEVASTHSGGVTLSKMPCTIDDDCTFITQENDDMESVVGAQQEMSSEHDNEDDISLLPEPSPKAAPKQRLSSSGTKTTANTTAKTTAKTTASPLPSRKKKTKPTPKDKQEQERMLAAEALMEERRKQRAERIQKVRERIAREEEEERTRKQEEASQQAALEMSEERRRERAYEWYLRSGMLSRNELKKRVVKDKDFRLVPEDIDLLPWNFNGSLVNASKMMMRKSMTSSRT